MQKGNRCQIHKDIQHPHNQCGCLFEWTEFNHKKCCWCEWCLALHEDRSHSQCVCARNPLCEAGDPVPTHLQIPVTHLKKKVKYEPCVFLKDFFFVQLFGNYLAEIKLAFLKKICNLSEGSGVYILTFPVWYFKRRKYLSILYLATKYLAHNCVFAVALQIPSLELR